MAATRAADHKIAVDGLQKILERVVEGRLRLAFAVRPVRAILGPAIDLLPRRNIVPAVVHPQHDIGRTCLAGDAHRIGFDDIDIDRQVVRMLPDELTVGRIFLPFDLISRTIMVAVCNPFDAAAREEVQQSLDYTVTWYLAKPAIIIKTLQDIYRLGPQT